MHRCVVTQTGRLGVACHESRNRKSKTNSKTEILFFASYAKFVYIIHYRRGCVQIDPRYEYGTTLLMTQLTVRSVEYFHSFIHSFIHWVYINRRMIGVIFIVRLPYHHLGFSYSLEICSRKWWEVKGRICVTKTVSSSTLLVKTSNSTTRRCWLLLTSSLLLQRNHKITIQQHDIRFTL